MDFNNSKALQQKYLDIQKKLEKEHEEDANYQSGRNKKLQKSSEEVEVKESHLRKWLK